MACHLAQIGDNRMRTFVSFLLVSVLALAGCEGAPKFAWNTDKSTPGNHVSAGKFQLDLNEKTKVTATNIRSGRIGLFGTKFDADSLVIEQDPATFTGVLAGMDRYAIQQDRYWHGLNDVLDRVPPIIQSIAPIASAFIQANGNVALQKALRPTLVQQLAGGLTGNLITPELIQGVFNAIDPKLAADAVKAATPPTTQSTDSKADAGPLDRAPTRDERRRDFAFAEAADLRDGELVRIK